MTLPATPYLFGELISPKQPLSPHVANAVWDVLENHQLVKVSAANRELFVEIMTCRPVTTRDMVDEYRLNSEYGQYVYFVQVPRGFLITGEHIHRSQRAEFERLCNTINLELVPLWRRHCMWINSR